MTSFSVQAFGCRVNQAEAFSWTEKLQRQGLIHVEDALGCDLVLVNTCTLTNRADSDVRKFIRRVARLNPGARLVLTGCYVEGRRPELESLAQVWRVFPNNEKERLAEAVADAFGRKMGLVRSSFRSRAPVKVQEGCDLKCSFCIIPRVRGKSASVDRERVIGQIRDLVDQGYSEVVLTGVHLCLYGLDLKPPLTLLDLIRDIEAVRGLKKLRLSSLDPRFMSRELVDHIASSDQVCPHFHLSLQSGSNPVLRRMGRGPTAETAMDLLLRLREKSPSAALGADILVGFPGETEADFEDTYRYLEISPLDYLHVFSYSPRAGTPAAEWPPIEARIRKRRARRLRALSGRKYLAFRLRFAGCVLDAVVVERRNSGLEVLTSNYIRAHIPAAAADEKSAVRVRLRRIHSQGADGDLETGERESSGRPASPLAHS